MVSLTNGYRLDRAEAYTHMRQGETICTIMACEHHERMQAVTDKTRTDAG